jgi:uncharacterized membrane protein YphA (DoxX/SURF4 family)
MTSRPAEPSAGAQVYGFASVLLGASGLVWHDFARPWQPIQSFRSLPNVEALAYVAAAALIFGGLTVQRQSTARAGAVLLGLIYFGFAWLWLPRIVDFPRLAGPRAGFIQELAMVVPAILIYMSATPGSPALRLRTALTGRILFGFCALSFGVNHFYNLRETAALVPTWIPPNQIFWAELTGGAFLLAGFALLSGVLALLAARLLTVMFILFGTLVWLPRLFTDTHSHAAWAGNAINLAIAGAAWVVADALARPKGDRQDIFRIFSRRLGART